MTWIVVLGLLVLVYAVLQAVWGENSAAPAASGPNHQGKGTLSNSHQGEDSAASGASGLSGVQVGNGGARVRRVYGADQIGIVGFSDRGFALARPADAFAPSLLECSQKLHERVGGMTNIADGLRQAIGLLEAVRPGMFRRIWLLSDGYPNVEVNAIDCEVQRAQAAGIRICTIGFGDQYDEALLRRISEATRGRFVAVHLLRQLTEALVRASGQDIGRNRRRHPAETTILVIDLSGSMAEPMEGKTKVAVVEEAVLQLLYYKQRCWS